MGPIQEWEVNIGTIEVQYLYHMGAIWAPIMYLEIITFPGLFQFYLGDPHILEFIFIVIEFYQYGTYKGLIRAKKAYMGPM